ncbi:adenosine deaminase [Pseudomonas turukhanskensis]|uniref:Adenine deaminase n=1 Tax=Pseudomonas turukhanskensis TaxID=1806536 RepID=A0A9W6K821_9PSED|nr:adenosine deaminase [Pseudomonas turukhanskensis]GLK91245.1 adenine deaminase [Pseudomonas turukhanskensis]
MINNSDLLTTAEAVRLLPKAELHLHLEGSISLKTLIELAHQHHVQLPPKLHAEAVLEYRDLDEFIDVSMFAFQVIRTSEDFTRVTFEMLSHCAEHGARHVEFFFSPSSHRHLGYPQILQAICGGMRLAEQRFGITSLIIPSHNRMLGAEAGLNFLKLIESCPAPEVVGVGLEFAERNYPPELYGVLFGKAKKMGLRLTAHAGEDGPAAYVETCLTLLSCDRIDHGYHVIDDNDLMGYCKDRGVWFTCCPTTTKHTTTWKQLTSSEHAIHQMIAAGLNVTINTDDPGFFQTDLTQEYLSLGLPLETLACLALNSLEASWMPGPEKARLRELWQAEIDDIIQRHQAH